MTIDKVIEELTRLRPIVPPSVDIVEAIEVERGHWNPLTIVSNEYSGRLQELKDEAAAYKEDLDDYLLSDRQAAAQEQWVAQAFEYEKRWEHFARTILKELTPAKLRKLDTTIKAMDAFIKERNH